MLVSQAYLQSYFLVLAYCWALHHTAVLQQPLHCDVRKGRQAYQLCFIPFLLDKRDRNSENYLQMCTATAGMHLCNIYLVVSVRAMIKELGNPKALVPLNNTISLKKYISVKNKKLGV
jgi:hypothetical protein